MGDVIIVMLFYIEFWDGMRIVFFVLFDIWFELFFMGYLVIFFILYLIDIIMNWMFFKKIFKVNWW